MKKSTLFLVILFQIVISISSCHKDTLELDISHLPGQGVELYLLKEYEMFEAQCKIDNSTIILESTALVFNDEIRYYELSTHTMGLSESAIERVKEIGDWGAFCVTVNKAIIYSGFFKPSYSSSTCFHSVTIDPLSYSGNKIHFNLGYPWSSLATIDGVDPRVNELLIQAFRNQGKLRE